MRSFTKSDWQKVCECVESSVVALGGRILHADLLKTVVKFRVVDCDLTCVQDRVNQHLGRYGYPWESWFPEPNLLKVAWVARG